MSKDELLEELQKKTQTITLAGKELFIRKWTLRQGMKHTATLAENVKKIGTSMNPANFMKMDLSEFSNEGADKIIDLLSDSIRANNFETPQQAVDYVEALDMGECAKLLAFVVRMNFESLKKNLGDLTSALETVTATHQAP